MVKEYDIKVEGLDKGDVKKAWDLGRGDGWFNSEKKSSRGDIKEFENFVVIKEVKSIEPVIFMSMILSALYKKGAKQVTVVLCKE